MSYMHHKNRKHADRISDSVSQYNTKICFFGFSQKGHTGGKHLFYLQTKE